MDEEMESQLNEILKDYIARKQIPIAASILAQFRKRGCYARSGKQLFVADLKVEAPRATVYRIVSLLEKLGLIDRESRFSGYFLSFSFSNKRDEQANFWRKFCKPSGKPPVKEEKNA